MSSTTLLETPDLPDALLWREATVQSNRTSAQNHELAREGLVEGLDEETVWRSFATHYRAQQTLERSTAVLEALAPADLVNRYRAEPEENKKIALNRAEPLKSNPQRDGLFVPLSSQLLNEVNPMAEQQTVLETTEERGSPDRPALEVSEELRPTQTLPSPAPAFQPGNKILVFEPARSQPAARDSWVAGMVNETYHANQYLSYDRNTSPVNGHILVQDKFEAGELRHATQQDLAQFASDFAAIEEERSRRTARTAEENTQEPLTRMDRAEVEQALQEKTSLRRKDLSGLDLSGLQFVQVDLSGSNLSNTIQENTVYHNSIAVGTDFSHSHLQAVSFTGTNAAQSNWSEAKIEDSYLGGTVYETGQKNTGFLSSLAGANFSGASIRNTSLEQLIAPRISFAGATLDGSTILHSEMTGANFREAQIVDQSDIVNTTLARSEWKGAAVEIDTAFAHNNFEQAGLQNIFFDGAKVLHNNFDSADLSGSSFRPASFQQELEAGKKPTRESSLEQAEPHPRSAKHVFSLAAFVKNLFSRKAPEEQQPDLDPSQGLASAEQDSTEATQTHDLPEQARANARAAYAAPKEVVREDQKASPGSPHTEQKAHSLLGSLQNLFHRNRDSQDNGRNLQQVSPFHEQAGVLPNDTMQQWSEVRAQLNRMAATNQSIVANNSFAYADLRDVNFEGSVLLNNHFDHAFLENVRFGNGLPSENSQTTAHGENLDVRDAARNVSPGAADNAASTPIEKQPDTPDTQTDFVRLYNERPQQWARDFKPAGFGATNVEQTWRGGATPIYGKNEGGLYELVEKDGQALVVPQPGLRLQESYLRTEGFANLFDTPQTAFDEYGAAIGTSGDILLSRPAVVEQRNGKWEIIQKGEIDWTDSHALGNEQDSEEAKFKGRQDDPSLIEDEERYALYDYLVDGPDGYLSHDDDIEDALSARSLEEVQKYADTYITQLQKESPGASFSELLEKVKAKDRAELHPSWDKPVIGPAEEKAKADLLELLADRHVTPWHLEHSSESTKEIFDRAERKAGDDLDRMVKDNPHASYVELLAMKTAQQSRAEGKPREFENSDLKADYNPLAGTVDTLDKQNNTQTQILVPQAGPESTQEQIETRLEEAKEEVESEQQEVAERRTEQRAEQIALHEDKNQQSAHGSELRLSEIEAELAGTRSLGRDYGHYSHYPADTQSGTYNGPITAETDHHLVQQISPRSNVIHEKQRLSPTPDLGDSVAVSYNRGLASVLPQQDLTRDLSRNLSRNPGMAR